MSIGAILDRALRIYLRHFWFLLAIALTFLVPVSLLYLALSNALGDSAVEQQILSMVVTLTVNVAVQSVLSGALIQAVSDIYLGDPVSLGRCFRGVATRVVPVVLATFLVTAIVFAGTMACFLPGLYLTGALFAVIPAVVLEKKGAIDAIARSWRLTTSMRIRAFAAMFFAQTLGSLIGTPVGFLAGMLRLAPLETQALTGVAVALVVPYASIVSILLYYDYRIRREAFDLQVLAAELHGGHGAP